MEKEQYKIMRQLEESLWWYLGMRGITNTLLTALSAPSNGLQILDAGCGTGANLDFLASRGAVFGIDIAPEALEYCQERGHRHVSQGSIQHLPFADDSFDLVTCFDVIYHRAVMDDVAALHEFYRVLRPRGFLLLRTPAYDWLRGSHDIAVHTRHRYSGHELRTMLQMAGFRVVRITHANCFTLPAAVAKRMLESLGATFRSDLDPPSPLVNRALMAVLGLEARVLRCADLPLGLSVIGVGVKECNSTTDNTASKLR